MEEAVEVSSMLLMASALTLTVQLAETPLPSAAVQVTVAVPEPTAVTKPAEDTVATLVLLDYHVTFLFVALLGETDAFRVPVFPTLQFRLELSSVIDVTGW